MLIREIAAKLHTTPRAIRFYEEKGLIAPQKEPHNGYRRYSEREAWRLQTILALREVGMPIARIRQVLERIDRGENEEIRLYLELQRTALFEEWLRLKQWIATVEEMIARLGENPLSSGQILWQLSDRLRRAKAERNRWTDRWNFDALARRYDEMVAQTQGEEDLHRDYDSALDLTAEWAGVSPGEEGLEIGVGTGNLARRFLEKGVRLTGVDQSIEMLKVCREKLPQLPTRPGNFLALPFGEEIFDFVVTSFAFHHLTDEQKQLALDEMIRVLKPGGRILILDLMVPNAGERERLRQKWTEERKTGLLRSLEDEYWSDLSLLRHWFEKRGFSFRSRKIHDFLHLVRAERMETIEKTTPKEKPPHGEAMKET
jgi:putative AdoMet-dependent methyltransferase